MGFAMKKVAGGKLIEAEVETSGGRITSVRITGDFFAHPEEVIEEVERRLAGAPAKWGEVLSRIRSTLEKMNAVLVGVSAEDIAEVVLKAAGVELR